MISYNITDFISSKIGGNFLEIQDKYIESVRTMLQVNDWSGDLAQNVAIFAKVLKP